MNACKPVVSRLAATSVVALLLLCTGFARVAAAQATSAPFLWEARHGESRVWLFGTIHVPDDRVLALPPIVRDAFTSADRVLTELPMDTAAQAEIAAALLLPEGQRLRAIVGDARFARLEARVRAIVEPQVPLAAPVLVAMLDRLKPWAAMAQFVSLEYLAQTMEGKAALDQQLYADALAAGKKVGGLETVAEQAGIFEAFSQTEQLRMLDETLDEMDAPTVTSRDLVTWYVAGDEAKLRDALAQSSKDATLSKKFEDILITQRNRRMAERIDAARRQAPAETLFVAVGTLHLIGEDSVPARLESLGYTVRRASRP